MSDGRNGGASAPRPLLVPLIAGGAAVLALGVRLLALRGHEAANPLFAAGPILDEAIYVEGAARIAAGVPPTAADLLLSRPWPHLLALLGATTRHDAAVTNAWIGALTAAACAAFAGRLGGAVAAAVAGLLAAACGGLVFTDVTAQTEPLLSLATALAAGAFAVAAQAHAGRGAPSPSRRVAGWAAAAGALAGGAAWIRGTSALLLLGAVPLLAGAGRHRRVGAVIAGFAASAALGLALGGSLPRGGSLNVWLGNNAFARETRSYGTDEFVLTPEEQAARVAALDAGGGSFLSRAADEARAAPLATAGHVAVKGLLCVTRDEIPNVHDPLVEGGFSPWTGILWLRVWPALALAAAACVAVRLAHPGVSSLGWAVAGHMIGLALVFPLSRYRIPAVPVACMAAGLLAQALVSRAVEGRRALRAAVAGAAVGAAAFAGEAVRPPLRPESRTNLAIASLATDPAASEEQLRLAIGEDPAWGPALVMLGDALLSRRDDDRALSHYTAADTDAARSRWPDVWRGARIGRCRALSNLGRHEDALRLHDEARRVRPDDAALAADGALLALAKGDRAEARRRLGGARSVDPDDPAVLRAAAAVE